MNINNKLVVLSILGAGLASSLTATELVISGTSLAFDYMETVNGANFNSEKSSLGDIIGMDIAVRMGDTRGNDVKFINDIEFSYVKGETEYVGSFLNVPGSKYGDVVRITDNKLLAMKYKLGAKFKVNNSAMFGVVGGIGYREWERALADGNVETYYWGHWTAGVQLDTATKIGDFIFYGNYQRAIEPRMHASSIDTTFDLGKTNGFDAGVRWRINITRWMALETEYKYDTWDISASNVVNGYYEPDSNTRNQYVKAGIAFIF